MRKRYALLVVCICARARFWIGGCDLLRASTDLYVSRVWLVYLLTQADAYFIYKYIEKNIYIKYVYLFKRKRDRLLKKSAILC